MIAAIYTRVSTKEQKQEMQRSELIAFVARMGWEVKEYNETESSVKKRPIFESMMSDARLRKFDVLLVYKIDRLSRSIQQFLNTIFELDRMGIRFMSITQSIDTDQKSPAGRLIMNVLAAVAEFEREIILERVNSGIAEYRRKWEEGKVGKGYNSRTGKNKSIGRPRTIMDKYKAIELYKQGKSFRQVAAELKIKYSAVYAAIKEEFYLGRFIEGKHYKIDKITGCWIWLLPTDKDRYPKLGGKKACDLSYEMVKGEIPKDVVLHHTCFSKYPNKVIIDNLDGMKCVAGDESKLCINPEHLVCMTKLEHRKLHGDYNKQYLLNHPEIAKQIEEYKAKIEEDSLKWMRENW